MTLGTLGAGFGRMGAQPALGEGSAPTPPVTMFTANPALNADDHNAGTCFRVVVTLTQDLQDYVRVSIQPGTVDALSIKHASIGKYVTAQPLYPNMAAAPIELTFGGGSGFAGATATKVSDWIDVRSITAVAGDKLIIDYDVANLGAAFSSQRYNNAAVNATTFFHAGEYWNVADCSAEGFTKLTTFNYGIALVETRNGMDPGISLPIPLTFNDPMFTSMTPGTNPISLILDQDLTHTSIVEASGSPSVTCLGNNELTYCRVDSRECIRITDKDVLLDHCYLESTGVGADHADTIQAYSPSTRGGTISIKNTNVRSHLIAATAGIFFADNWGGSIVAQDVIIEGGPSGWLVHADVVSQINLSLKNVYFIGPFGDTGAPFDFIDTATGAAHTILQWDNVRYATHGSSGIILGDLIPQPASTPMPTNLIAHSDTFNLWSLTSVSITQNVANEPVFGALTADRIIETANAGGHSLNSPNGTFVSGTVYSASIFAKYETAQFIQLLLGSAAFGANAWGNFDIQNGTVQTAGSASTLTILDCGNGWFRLTLTATATASAAAPMAVFAANSGSMTRAASFTGVATNTRLIADAQVVAGAVAGPYVPTA